LRENKIYSEKKIETKIPVPAFQDKPDNFIHLHLFENRQQK